jgi:transposase
MLKPKIYNFVKQNKPACSIHKLNMLLSQHGHTTLRLPAYDPQLNPIEKIWALVKQWVTSHNVGRQNMGELIKLTR